MSVVAGLLVVYAAGGWWQHAQGGLGAGWTVAIFAIAFALTVVTATRGALAAGEDWLRHTFAFGSRWVRTTRLVRVTVETGYTGSTVHLRDDEGRSVHVRLAMLAAAPPVWQPVHAGLRESLRRGNLHVDRATREALGLPRERPSTFHA